MTNDIFKKDLYRFYKGKRETILERIYRPMELKYIYCMRKIKSSKNIISKLYYKIRLHNLSKKTMIQIPSKTNIGEGFYIGHTGRVIINVNAKIGKNVNISTGVTIGQENRGKRKGCPTIGNRVFIGTNAVIVGNITIGDNVLIAPNAYVNIDVPNDSIVIGNPALIHPNKNATDGYVENLV